MSGRYLLSRLLFSAITFFLIVSAVFFLLRAAPGGPFDGERTLTPEIEANLRAAYDLDDPLPEQYLKFWARLARGDLGPSFRQRDFSVNELVATGLPVSLRLGVTSLCLALALGLLIGICAGWRPGHWLDRALMATSNLNLAVPAIISAPLMVLAFAVVLRWLPAGGTGNASHFVLPVLALALPLSAQIARLVRGGVAEALVEPHVKTARAKGLSSARIAWRHVLPIALIPTLSFLAPATAGLLTGSVVVEQIFDLPGIGRYFVQGALDRDYTLVMGVTIVYTFAILSLNFLADLAYGWLDPRIRIAT